MEFILGLAFAAATFALLAFFCGLAVGIEEVKRRQRSYGNAAKSKPDKPNLRPVIRRID